PGTVFHPDEDGRKAGRASDRRQRSLTPRAPYLVRARVTTTVRTFHGLPKLRKQFRTFFILTLFILRTLLFVLRTSPLVLRHLLPFTAAHRLVAGFKNHIDDVAVLIGFTWGFSFANALDKVPHLCVIAIGESLLGQRPCPAKVEIGFFDDVACWLRSKRN